MIESVWSAGIPMIAIVDSVRLAQLNAVESEANRRVWSAMSAVTRRTLFVCATMNEAFNRLHVLIPAVFFERRPL